MVTHKEAYEAFKILDKYCDEHDCNHLHNCIFDDGEFECCLLDWCGNIRITKLEELERLADELDAEEKSQEWAGDAYIVKPEDC